MPKRMVDGERIWTSDKISQIQPEQYRSEYANLLPLALANGSFECSARRVWRDVYSYNRPSFNCDAVERLLREMERVKLLFRWRDEDERIWGFWVGIKVEGLLPAKSHVDRGDYKKGKEPPIELFQKFMMGLIGSGLDTEQLSSETGESQGGGGDDTSLPPPRFGLDRVGKEGIGELSDSSSLEEQNGQGETIMRAKKHIPITCLKVLGCKAETWDSTWDEVKQYEQAFGGTEVCYSFDEWAETVKGEIREKPVTAWLKIAAGLLSGTISLSADTAVDDLVIQLAIASKGRVSFDNKQKSYLSKSLKKRQAVDIVSGLKEYISDLDEGGFRFAGQKFSETVDQHAAAAEVRRIAATSEALAADRAREIMVAEAVDAQAARKKAREEEEALVEDVLE